ncbi:MAG: hypothetical protein SP4CHLAM5_06780 [Chlamydiia bacterium]|nr:hypothetical protein [Chlamydiia bacterium]
MIIKGMSYTKWQKIVQMGTTFFSVIAIFLPIFTLFCYLLDSDFSTLMGGKASYANGKKKKLVESKSSGDHSIWNNETHQAYIPIPDIEKSIFFTGYNYRPDANHTGSRLISLSSSKNKLFAKEKERIYLNCSDPMSITFSEKSSPYSLVPMSIDNKGLTIRLEVKYEKKTGEIIYESNKELLLKKTSPESVKVTKAADDGRKSLMQTSLFAPDTMISLIGGKEYSEKKDKHRLYFKKNQTSKCCYVKSGDMLSYVNGIWKKSNKALKNKPLFKVSSIDSTGLHGTFWNETGFYQKNYTIQLNKKTRSSIHSFSFDKIYKRNNESVICKIKDRTFLIKPHDWLIKKNSTWHHIKNLSEFTSLVNLDSLNELIIFEGILKEKEKELFIGYIFDSVRSNYKKLEIPLKKKETPSYTR